jgi:predicted O-methyltransferase YrrM
MNDRAWQYLRHGKKHVKGWLQRVDAEIIGAILSFQYQKNITGACVEIGVHHGKSFIPLCLALRKDELALGIDLFDDQAKNIDVSGAGDYEAFQQNLKKFGVDTACVRIFSGSSEDVEAERILNEVGQARYFSVDGGHWKKIVRNDLCLAEKTLVAGGVIALDDYCRADWPEVTAGYSLWQEQTISGIVPFAIGSNKLYLCHREYASKYRETLSGPFLKEYFSKTYRASDHVEIDSYRCETISHDEEQAARAVSFMLKVFRPDQFLTLKRMKKFLWGKSANA